MHQSAPGKTYIVPNISINGQLLRAVDKFTHIGSKLSRNAVIDNEANARLYKMSALFGRLQKNKWTRRDIAQKTKIKVYRAIILTTFL